MSKKILIIDDEPLLLKSLQKALSKIGYEVYTAINRDEFLKHINHMCFDLIVMDLHIPDLNTEEIIEITREKNPETRFLIISGSEFSTKLPYIQKPFSINQFRDKIRELLNESHISG